jgi:hypothetical protein
MLLADLSPLRRADGHCRPIPGPAGTIKISDGLIQIKAEAISHPTSRLEPGQLLESATVRRQSAYIP